LPSDGSWGKCIADPSQHRSACDANLALIEAYTYDATGNRLSQQIGNNPVIHYSYPAQSHRLIQVGAAARSFDAVGNTLTGVPGYEADSATYDARNRLAQVGSGSSAQLLSNYNGRGERVLVSQGAPAPELPTTSAAWRSSAGVRGYVYDESGQVISMLIAGSPLRYEEIIWLDHTPIGRVESSTSAVTAVHVIHSDHLNTPRALANAQTQGGQPAGTVVWRWKLNQQTATGSNAFGAQPADEDPDGNGTSVRFDLRFPGQQYDAATGLHYNYFRDYEPGTGRYVESDPIGLRGGVSTYGYVMGNTLIGVDPTALVACFYNIGLHQLRCYADPDPNFVGPPTPGPAVTLGGEGVFSGRAGCRNNPSQTCVDSSNNGPIPPGEYFMNPDGRSGRENHWRLEPNPPVSFFEYLTLQRRNGFKLHPGSISLGCITINSDDQRLMASYNYLHHLLQRDWNSGRGNYLYVAP
jgi:RHS repeat-associated protein